MGSWSTTKPTLPDGSSWSSEWQTGSADSHNNYFSFRVSEKIARGVDNAFYLQIRIQTNGKTYGQTSGTIPIRVRVSVGGKLENSGTYNCGGEYGGWTTARTVYYTGTAAPGTSIWSDAWWSNDSYDSGNVNFDAPDYVTTRTITFDGNGASSGEVASVTDVYGTEIELPSGDGFRYPGYGFVEWNTAADGSGDAYEAGATYTIEGDVTLYAQWVKTSIPVYINVGGSIKQVEQAYININDVIKECTPYINVGGTIYSLA